MGALKRIEAPVFRSWRQTSHLRMQLWDITGFPCARSRQSRNRWASTARLGGATTPSPRTCCILTTFGTAVERPAWRPPHGFGACRCLPVKQTWQRSHPR